MRGQAKQALMKIIEEVDRLDVHEYERRKFKQRITEICSLHGINGIDRGERVCFARHLLDEREPRKAIRDRLRARFDVSRSQAYRIIVDALTLSQNRS